MRVPLRVRESSLLSFTQSRSNNAGEFRSKPEHRVWQLRARKREWIREYLKLVLHAASSQERSKNSYSRPDSQTALNWSSLLCRIQDRLSRVPIYHWFYCCLCLVGLGGVWENRYKNRSNYRRCPVCFRRPTTGFQSRFSIFPSESATKVPARNIERPVSGILWTLVGGQLNSADGDCQVPNTRQLIANRRHAAVLLMKVFVKCSDRLSYSARSVRVQGCPPKW